MIAYTIRTVTKDFKKYISFYFDAQRSQVNIL